MEIFGVYKDIEARTGGAIYLGIVGPVRTGKSTFIKRFMELMVLPNMKDIPGRERARDELPQAASGKTIMTAEPKFIPKEAATIRIAEDLDVQVRLVDCVGYMVEGATGYMENGEERMVKTPWFENEIPFTKAATIGTQKVICDHATIGIVITTDGSIGEIPRENYIQAEEKSIRELQSLGKPFIVVVNSQRPYSQETKRLTDELKERYGVSVIAVNCEQLREEDVHRIMEQVLFEFPVSEVAFYIPKWVELLAHDHAVKQEIIKHVQEILKNLVEIKDAVRGIGEFKSDVIENMWIDHIAMDTGCVSVRLQVFESCYYEMLSRLMGVQVEDEYELVKLVKELAEMKEKYLDVGDAMECVRMKGYGVVNPRKEEIQVDEPVLIKQGNKYGVKIRSEAPSIHMIRANIETEIAPIVGSEAQARDLVTYIKDSSKSESGIWGAQIFGKSIEDMLMDGMRTKISAINDESQIKLQDTMQKIVNDSNGGMVCIII